MAKEEPIDIEEMLEEILADDEELKWLGHTVKGARFKEHCGQIAVVIFGGIWLFCGIWLVAEAIKSRQFNPILLFFPAVGAFLTAIPFYYNKMTFAITNKRLIKIHGKSYGSVELCWLRNVRSYSSKRNIGYVIMEQTNRTDEKGRPEEIKLVAIESPEEVSEILKKAMGRRY